MEVKYISQIANMKAECDCNWHGYGDDCYLIDGTVTCPECGSEVNLSLDDFSPFGEDW
jgi:hypothetical protein